jgi:hypothetical protein
MSVGLFILALSAKTIKKTCRIICAHSIARRMPVVCWFWLHLRVLYEHTHTCVCVCVCTRVLNIVKQWQGQGQGRTEGRTDPPSASDEVRNLKPPAVRAVTGPDQHGISPGGRILIFTSVVWCGPELKQLYFSCSRRHRRRRLRRRVLICACFIVMFAIQIRSCVGIDSRV